MLFDSCSTSLSLSPSPSLAPLSSMNPSFLDRFLEGFGSQHSPTMPEWKQIKRDHSRLFYNLWARAYPFKAPPAENLLDKERTPPARPLPLQFPDYKPPPTSEPLSSERMRILREKITQFRKPSDASDDFFACFNIQFEADVPLSSFVPEGQFEQRPFLYDSDLTAMLNELSFDNDAAFREVLRMPPAEGKTKIRLAYSRNFFASLEDMSRYWDDTKDNYYNVPVFDKDDDYQMSDANDSTQRTYTPVPNTGYDFMASSRLIRHRRPSQQSTATSTPTAENPSNVDADNDDAPSTSTCQHSLFSHLAPSKPVPEKEVYRGYRLGNAAQTPPTTHISAVRNLTKMFTHKFNCRDFDNGIRERLKIKDIVIPGQMVMYTFNVCRVPKDNALAKARFVEGPVMSVYVRHEVVFSHLTKDRLLTEEGRERNEIGEVLGSEFDLLKEVGGLLILALQRARGEKGKKEEYWEQETMDWWWAKTPRWGGGVTKWGMLASEIYDDEDPTWSPEERALQLSRREKEGMKSKKVDDVVKVGDVRIEDLMASSESGKVDIGLRDEQPLRKRTRIGLPERMRRGGASGGKKGAGEEKVEFKDGRRLMAVPPSKKKWYEDWMVLKPNSSPWDEKLIYRATGKVEGAFDDVYQIGSVNHHVCLTKMRVSRRYLRWIEKGVVDVQKESEENEEILRIQKSRWFDLFDIEQRKEFLVGMWRVMSWLNRDEVPAAEIQKMEVLKKEAVAAQ